MTASLVSAATKETVAIVLVAVLLGTLRQLAPQGIAWNGQWPGETTAAEDAYKMMAREGDPPFIGFEEVKRLHETKDATFIDARSSAEFAAGRIPGARNLPFYELEAYQQSALEGLAAAAKIIIYCEGVGCELSFFLGRELKAAGYTNLHIFYGGYPEWTAAGLPIEK